MKVADAHCDTLTTYRNNPFHSPEAHWTFEKFFRISGVLQYFAVFTPPHLSGESALSYAASHIGAFLMKKPESMTLLESQDDFDEEKINGLISLEGASPIVNNIENLHTFYKLGVRACTLTWNHRNFLADGIESEFGLTDFGKEAVEEMERLGIIVDVSHLNESGFRDVAHIAQKPFMASHSNSYEICAVKRNLKEWQIQEIVARGGFIGLNLYSDFIGNDSDDLIESFKRHINYFLNLNCENALGFGADFDGMDKSPFKDVMSYIEICGILRDQLGLDEELVEKIMFRNLVDFTLKMLGKREE